MTTHVKKLIVLLFMFVKIYQINSQIASDRSSFTINEPTVSTTFFIWFASNGGQLSGPWIPLEGRENWTGTPEWWKTQIKQVMMANIDIILVHLMHQTDERRLTLFQALYELRLEGYEVPKVAPYLDPLITWGGGNDLDMANEADKDTFVDQYIRFYNLYFEKNPDEYAEDYLAKMDNKLILDTWHTFVTIDNIELFTRNDLESRLAAAFPSRLLFQNGIYMLTTALNDPLISFADERVVKFEINDYYQEFEYNGITTATLKGGYWDQNIRTPGDFLPRNGGIDFKDAWQAVSPEVTRLYIESWNEYDEGTGIYAADISGPYIAPSNTSGNTDTWSTDNDPYEYIRTTAEYSSDFNNISTLDARIISHNLPDTVVKGETYSIEVLVQNSGNQSWTGANGIQFGIQNSTVDFGEVFDIVDDLDPLNEIDIYEGIFRGRPVQFTFDIIIPEVTDDTIDLMLSMFEVDTSFGNPLNHTFIVEDLNTNTVENEREDDISIYPNPVTDNLFFNVPNEITSWWILDSQGKIIQKGEVSNSKSISVEALVSGVYYLKLTDANSKSETIDIHKFTKN